MTAAAPDEKQPAPGTAPTPAPGETEVDPAAALVPVENSPTSPREPEPTAPDRSTSDESAPEPTSAGSPKRTLPIPPQSAADPAPVPIPVRRGPSQSSEAFSARLQSGDLHRAGQKSHVYVILEAKPPFKCNDQYPYKFTFDGASQNIQFPSPVVRGMNVGGRQGSMALPIEPVARGPARVSGEFSFSVCTDDQCLIEKHTLWMDIEVR